MDNVDIHNASAATSIYIDTISFSATKLKIQGNEKRAFKGGGLYSVNSHKFEVHNSTFRDLFSKEGGAIFIEELDVSKDQDEHNFTIKGSHF